MLGCRVIVFYDLSKLFINAPVRFLPSYHQLQAVGQLVVLREELFPPETFNEAPNSGVRIFSRL